MRPFRPKGWQNPHKRGVTTMEQAREDAYEEGADAMYNALKEVSLYGEYLEDFVISAIVKPDNPDWAEPFFKSITKRGWLVFIDDE